MISIQIKLCTQKVPGQAVSLKTPACHYKPGTIRPRAAWSLRCWEQAAVQSLPGSGTGQGSAHAGLHCTLSTAWFSVYLLTINVWFLFKGKFQRAGGCHQWKDNHWVSAWARIQKRVWFDAIKQQPSFRFERGRTLLLPQAQMAAIA